MGRELGGSFGGLFCGFFDEQKKVGMKKMRFFFCELINLKA
jgi:hypothetical protein